MVGTELARNGEPVVNDPLPRKRRKWERPFLAALSKSGHIRRSCELAKVTKAGAYQLRDIAPDFREAWEDALQEYIETLEAEADRRAIEGWYEPVYHRGEQVGQVKKFSDTLLIFRLNGLAPEKYRARVEHSGPGGGPIYVKALIGVRIEDV